MSNLAVHAVQEHVGQDVDGEDPGAAAEKGRRTEQEEHTAPDAATAARHARLGDDRRRAVGSEATDRAASD